MAVGTVYQRCQSVLSVVCHSYCFIHICVRAKMSVSRYAPYYYLPTTMCAYFTRSTNGWHLGKVVLCRVDRSDRSGVSGWVAWVCMPGQRMRIAPPSIIVSALEVGPQFTNKPRAAWPTSLLLTVGHGASGFVGHLDSGVHRIQCFPDDETHS